MRRCAIGLGLSLSFGGCALILPTQYAPPPSQQTTRAPAPEVRILHAQLSSLPGEEGLSGVWLVFSDLIDPSTVRAEAFALVLASGERRPARAAHFGPADERDEARSLFLEVDLRDGGELQELEQVQIFGGLYAYNGATLRGADALVEPLGPPQLIAAKWIGAEGDCEASSASVRTWWSDVVLAGETGFSISNPMGGASTGPLTLSEVETLLARPDNVVDVCVPGDMPASLGLRLHVKSGALTGLGGAASGAVEMEVEVRVPLAESSSDAPATVEPPP